MKCPVCNVDLLLSEKQGIEIDYCPKCRGIWLDRGELEKILERSSEIEFGPKKNEDNFRERRYNDNDDDKFQSTEYYKRRKKSFLGELFDFD
ncbi:MAG: zf-TFIIB domain-containing protein [Ignavibacteriae bacterium]|nr:zf-TFIIB domain-containing protein [Ignavibacteriota bacterium]